MLDTTTKRKIDDARDILVGKVPVSSSQVEQITIAMIYKFMYDMDNESIELGGNPKYFTGDFAQYAWNKLFDPKLSGEGRIQLYQDALAKIPNNAEIPSLFRDIFKNAFLPYRDPETLKLFLKCIDEFTYDHSEKLGDAFEYLLAVLGSQGDAGQFRTPRHIIDFMVELIDPQKEDSILDPACGTAGFLISAYKHILKTNSSNYDKLTAPHSFAAQNIPLAELVINGKKYSGDLLTPDQRAFLHQNIKGYDIAFEMVRLSLVNMYLHGFNTPQIYEYDTLTSTERWNEYANVILANPPFMTPKGGIRPHQKFTIQAKRSEVLFVDYMLEHLTNNGKAGIIVPEGIIFQSGKAYKQLRKLLVEENYLVGVISLPGGVFNPYSGVKTSILWIDKVLAKKTDKIIFLKINNDGFDLGAQRRPIEANDLPSAFANAMAYKEAILSQKDYAVPDKDVIVAEKTKLAENGDFNLSGERYATISVSQSQFPVVQLVEVCDIIAGQSPDGKYYNTCNEGTPFYQGKTEFTEKYLGKPTKWTTKTTKIAIPNDVVMSVRAPVGPVNIVQDKICIGRGLAAIRSKENVSYKYCFYMLHSLENSIKGTSGSTFASINKAEIEKIQIPLPPLSVQEEIVAELDSYQKIIDGAKQVVDNWKPHIDIDPGWEEVELGDVCTFVRGPFGGSLKKEIFVKSGYCVYEQQHAIYGDFDRVRYFITEDKYQEMKRFTVSPGEIIMSCSGTMGKVAIIPDNAKPGIINQALLKLHPSDRVLSEYLSLILAGADFQKELIGQSIGVAIVNVPSVKTLKNTLIPLPNLTVQHSIVNHIEKEQKLVDANQELIILYKQKIKDRIEKLWIQE